jgi:hypothetical protein
VNSLLKRVQELVRAELYKFSDHALEKLIERNMVPNEIVISIETAILIESYPEYWLGPCVLARQTLASGRHVHVVWGLPKDHPNLAVLVTTYCPDPERWSENLLSRFPKRLGP